MLRFWLIEVPAAIVDGIVTVYVSFVGVAGVVGVLMALGWWMGVGLGWIQP